MEIIKGSPFGPSSSPFNCIYPFGPKSTHFKTSNEMKDGYSN